MVRFLYVRLLRMHPSAFRESFASEMLWIFDETAQTERPSAMLLDCFVSLFRQWILRSGFWKIVLAFTGASLQFLAISLCWRLPAILPCSEHGKNSAARGMSGTELLLIGLAVAAVARVGVIAFRVRNRLAGSADQIA